jgi:hypothetical protein
LKQKLSHRPMPSFFNYGKNNVHLDKREVANQI